MAQAVGRAILVDNTPEGSATAKQAVSLVGHTATLISNNANLGIATALNQGITAAFAAGARLVFLFDQDSEPSAEIFHGLNQAIDTLKSKGTKVALVGPAYFDTRQGVKFPFIRLDGLRFRRMPAEGHTPIEVSYLITSGSCIDLAAWQEIGGMDETLFIDCVDIEWGLRAKAKGFHIFGIPDLVMQHTLGEEPVVVFGKKYPLHSPLRHYYFFRNTTLLLKRAYIPLGWKLQEFYKIPLRFVVYSMFTNTRWAHMCMMLRGLRDGVLGRLGKYHD